MGVQIDDTDIRRMSVEERLELVDRIYVSIDEEQYELTPSLRRELERRLADLEANPDEGSPWEEVKARIRAKLRSSKSVSAKSQRRKLPRRPNGTKSKKTG